MRPKARVNDGAIESGPDDIRISVNRVISQKLRCCYEDFPESGEMFSKGVKPAAGERSNSSYQVFYVLPNWVDLWRSFLYLQFFISFTLSKKIYGLKALGENPLKLVCTNVNPAPLFFFHLTQVYFTEHNQEGTLRIMNGEFFRHDTDHTGMQHYGCN